MGKVLIIDGSYRKGGVGDQAAQTFADYFEKNGTESETLYLRDIDINFCTNCRSCTQIGGEAPGKCVQDDQMAAIIEKIEGADSFVFISPTNFYTITAIFKRFLERLVVFTYWPWGKPAPAFRKKPTKKAVVVTSSAAPGILTRLFFNSLTMLKRASKTVGAKNVDSIVIGLTSMKKRYRLTPKERAKIEKAAKQLAA